MTDVKKCSCESDPGRRRPFSLFPLLFLFLFLLEGWREVEREISERDLACHFAIILERNLCFSWKSCWKRGRKGDEKTKKGEERGGEGKRARKKGKRKSKTRKGNHFVGISYVLATL